MKNYKTVALRYLQLNKRRNVITVCGTAFTVLLLYILLNAGFSYLDIEKEAVLRKSNYEMILYTETIEDIQAISADAVVKEAKVGGWYEKWQGKNYEQALYVTGDNPYRMDKNFEYLCKTYGVEGEINQDLAPFYLQGYEGDSIYVQTLLLLCVSYIFALFGVGVIRNSIQLSIFEQIKDYGNMRCIGATKGQLKMIIYLQGLMLELLGILLGVVIGQVGMSLVCLLISFEMRFHVLPCFLIVFAYMLDLYFVMQDNCRLVTEMSPMSALRGEFRIRKEKIKRRRKSLYGRLFGVEGDYAYKNLMRSPGRFFKSVGAMFFGIAALIAFLGISDYVNRYYDVINRICRYYQVFYYDPLYCDGTIAEVQKNLPPLDYFEGISKIQAVQEAKKVYMAEVAVADVTDFINHFAKDHPFYMDFADYKKRDETRIEQEAYYASKMMCYGYDDEDYARYESRLVAGTLDVSENGIVLINGAEYMVAEDETLKNVWDSITYTTYQVGDTIDIIDPEKLRQMIVERLAKIPKGTEYNYPQICTECKKALREQGAYKTYVVEGIVDFDCNIENYDLSIILPLEHYYAFTNTDESYVTGMQYHIEGDLSAANIATLDYFDPVRFCTTSSYIEFVGVVGQIRLILRYILIFAIFLVIVTSANIVNTTASNIQMRRKEFAQLRVIGVSQKGLIKMVVLEGVITTIVTNFLGIAVGNVISYIVYIFMNMIMGIEFSIPWEGILLGLLYSVVVFCGSAYIGIKSMKQNVAGDLAISGE
ncbi:MAG: ABC transporter permease [Lachnospiraceae bacterium]|nr:ABC transporter permease [Lachnospiraceae bacterium]